jgi:hypothetical protein
MPLFHYCRSPLFTLPIRAAAVLVALLTATVGAAEPRDSSSGSKGDIVVAAVHGDVTATMAGTTAPLHSGAILQLPATIRTGHNGALELRQGSTTIAAAGNTELEIPQSAAEEGLIERVVQISGNAFYNVAKRERSKLRVETPHLVAVIKGTQFNVALQDDSTTIALFEGRLEVWAADESDLVDLSAGEIAIRRHNDVTISVLSMTTAASGGVHRDHGASSAHVSAGAPTDMNAPSANGSMLRPAAEDSIASNIDADAVSETGASGLASRDDAERSSVLVDPSDVGGIGAGVLIEAGVDTAPDSLGASTNASADFGVDAVAAMPEASVSLGGADLGLGANVASDLGAASVDAGTSVAIDIGRVGAAADVSTGLDLTTGSVAADVGASIDTGDASIDVGLGASADAGSVVASTEVVVTELGNVNVGVDVGAGATVEATVSAPGVDVGASVEVTGGNVGVDISLGDVLDIELDLGSDTADEDVDIDSDDKDGGLLRDLLNRRDNK